MGTCYMTHNKTQLLYLINYIWKGHRKHESQLSNIPSLHSNTQYSSWFMKSTAGLTNQIHWLALNSKLHFGFALKVPVPSTAFPSLFTSPVSLLPFGAHNRLKFPFFIHLQSNRVRHSELTRAASAFPRLGICLMELSHILETRSSFVLPLLALGAHSTTTLGWHGDHPNNTATPVRGPSTPKNRAEPRGKHSQPAHCHLLWWNMLPQQPRSELMGVIYIISLPNAKQQGRNLQRGNKNSFQLIF